MDKKRRDAYNPYRFEIGESILVAGLASSEYAIVVNRYVSDEFNHPAPLPHRRYGIMVKAAGGDWFDDVSEQELSKRGAFSEQDNTDN